MPSLPFLKKKKTTSEKDLLDLSYLVDRISLALEEEFSHGNVGRDAGFLSKSKTVGILPAGTMPPYGKKLNRAQLKDFALDDRYAGFVNGTAVKRELLEKIIGALDREKMGYKILVNRREPMPLIITTENANIIISHMLVNYR